ncbi:2'-deoxycytidine 5'-triphosphate deaminase [Candidatus Uhrbacteria bacterium]|nr:2'-deoxycytidine 5'-triphosphate deaminase [Candidatus Uhrbacteria bacterium]
MSILTRSEITKHITDQQLVFTPALDQFQLQPHAVDLRLGYKFLIPRNWTVDEKGRRAINMSIDDIDAHRDQFDEVQLQPGQYFDLLPNEFVIGTSLERIEINAMNLMAILFPRTSTNRRGIDLSLSGIIDTGYKGHLIFPMKNEAGDQVIRIYPGERVCQVIFQELNHPLTPEEANLHGLSAAKYSGSGSQGFKLDKDEERQMLISGKLDDLKKEYGL